MQPIPLDVIGVVTGIIGAISGIISLIWHVHNNQSKLKLECISFEKTDPNISQGEAFEYVDVKINLRNIGTRSTTIEELNIWIGNLHQEPKLFKEFTISSSSSKKLSYKLTFDKNDWTKYELFSRGKEEFGIYICHTFGNIRKKAKGDFRTGYFSIYGNYPYF